MKNLKLFIIAIFGLLTLFACRPTTDEDGNLLHGLGNSGGGSGGGSGSGGTTGAKVLSKFNTFDDNGNPFIYTFIYTNKILTKVTTSDNSYTSNITYSNGNISKVESVVLDSSTSQNTTITSNISYNTAGNISKVVATEVVSVGGSAISTTDKISTYSYNSSNQVVKVVQDYTISGMQTQTAIFDYTYSGSNMTKLLLTTHLAFSPIPDVVVTTTFSNFDSKISAFSTLSKNYQNFSLSEIGLGFFGSANNPAKMNVTETFLGTSTDTALTYTYDSENYTTSVTSNGEKSTFEYTKL